MMEERWEEGGEGCVSSGTEREREREREREMNAVENWWWWLRKAEGRG